jgi:hypothetical protein
LIQVHNKSAYNRIYSSLAKDFIDTYCQNRLNGLDTGRSLDAAKVAVQIKVSLEIVSNSTNKQLVLRAYSSIKQDAKLIKRAIKYYQSMKQP